MCKHVLKDSAFNSLQDGICLRNSLGGGGGGEQTHSQPSVYMYKFCLSQRVCMYMYLVGLEPYAMASAFFHVPTLCMQAEKALVRLQGMHMLVCAFAACICDKYKSRITLLTC